MIRIHADATGKLLRVDFPLSNQPAPEGTVESLDFDEESNPALAADLGPNAAAYWLQGGILHRYAEAVTINPDSQSTLDEQAIQAKAAQLRAFIDLPSPTNAQVVEAVKLTAQGLLLLAKRAGIVEA